MREARLISTIISTVILALTQYSCIRIGNNTEKTPDPIPTFTGYYQTNSASANALEFCKKDFNQVETCSSKNPSYIPSDVAGVMMNPVALQILDESTGKAALFNPFNTSYYLNINVNPVYLTSQEATLGFSGATTPSAAWDSPNCVFQLQLLESGKVTRSGLVTVQDLPTFGRIKLEIDVRYQFEGTCTSDLEAMEACYLDVAKCGDNPAADQLYLQQIYSPFIDAGTMTAAEISDLVQLRYRARYE